MMNIPSFKMIRPSVAGLAAERLRDLLTLTNDIPYRIMTANKLNAYIT